MRIDNERVRAVLPLIAAVYEHSCAGGNLHIALDDNNLEDSNLEFCSKCIDGAGVMPLDGSTFPAHLRYNEEKRADPDPPEQLAAERACCDALMAMTYEERVSALGLWDGCWALEEPKPVDAVDPDAGSGQSGPRATDPSSAVSFSTEQTTKTHG